jgi:NitT/TauT family transport system substrate-binding protein
MHRKVFIDSLADRAKARLIVVAIILLLSADLKGKTLGVSRFGSLTDIGLRKALNEFGLDPALDIKMIQTGGVPEILQFMQQGVVKGGVISSPTLERAKELGYKEFLNLGETKYRYPSTVLVTTDSFIKSRPQTLNRFLKATLEGLKYSKANPDFSVRVLSKYTRNADTKLLDSAFTSTLLAYVRAVPTVTNGEMESVLEAIGSQNPKAKSADPKQFYDLAPLEQLSREGFIKEIHPR